jgi:hypothetical protein
MSMTARRYTATCVLGLMLSLTVFAAPVHALPAPAGTQAGHPVQTGARDQQQQKPQSGGSCHVEVPVIGGIAGGICEAAGEAAGTVGGAIGEVAGAVGNGVLDLISKWMIGAATQVTTFVSREMQQSTTPQLESTWYEAQFRPMADLGAALGLLVALIALASAAVRRDPAALAGTIAGIARAGLGTGLVVALTVIGLGIADQVSSAVVGGSPQAFYATVAHAWGSGGFGGFGSSALAMLIAIVEVFAAVFVWLELIVRNAAIYIAVLFFPAALAAAIWPALSAWPGRLGRLLLLFVILKPVVLIVLSLAGNAAAAGLSFGSGGVSGSVGTILAATVIFALAAFAPWALMYLLAADAESAYMAAGLRTATGTAVGDEDGPSVRSGGGLRNLASNGGGAPGGSPSGGASSDGGGGGSDGGGGPGGGSEFPSGGAATAGESPGGDVGGGEADGALPVGGEMIGAGSVGAAAGIGAPALAASADTAQTYGGGGQADASPGQESGGGQVGSGAARPLERAPAAVASAPSSGGGGAAAGASSERAGVGSADGTDPTEEQSSGRSASGSSRSASGGSLPHGTGSLASSPRRRASTRSPALSLVPSPPAGEDA